MKDALARASEWLAGLAPRERLAVLVGGVLLALTLVFLIVWEPMSNAREDAAAALATERALAGRLELVQAEVNKARQTGRGAVNRNLSLLAAVDQASRSGTLGAAPSRLQPDGDKEVKVWLEDVSFDKLLRWLAELEQRYGVVAQAAEIEREAGPGLVNARLTLVRP